MDWSRKAINVNCKTQYSWKKGVALYMVRPAWYSLLWATPTWWNCYCQSICSTINQFEPWTKRKTTRQNKHEKVILLHDNARPHVTKSVTDVLKKIELRRITAPAVFSCHCFIGLLFVSVHGTRSVRAAIQELCRSEKMIRWMDIFKQAKFFYDGIHKLLINWNNVVINDGNYFYNKYLF